MRYDWHDGGWGFGPWVAMGVMMLIFLAAVAAVVVYVLRNPVSRSSGEAVASSSGEAMRILDERFAR